MADKCFWCKQVVDRVPIVDLVWTWEPFKVDDDLEGEELREVVWHKECYAKAQKEIEQA
jgi:hypothetical protein